MNAISNYLSNAVKNYALRNWRLYSFKQEWLTIIILVIVAKIATSIVSVFSGYCYLDNIFFGLFASESLSRVVTVFALVLIELLNALFLAKFFKFLLRMNNLKWVFPLLLSVALFALSFVISTNGIAIYTAGKVDLSKNIAEKYITEIRAVDNDYKEQTAIIQEHINNVKANPSEWKDGKRCVLSTAQLAEIREQYDKITELTNKKESRIKALNEEKAKELQANSANTENEADKYYLYVAVIMFIQLVASLALWFFWCKISAEDDPETNKVEAVSAGLAQIENTVDGCINARVDGKLAVLETIYAKIAAENDKLTIAAKEEKTPKSNVRIMGFDNVKNDDTATDLNALTRGVSTLKKTPVTSQNVNATPENFAVCEECGKALNQSQIVRRARFCCPSCRVKNYNKTHTGKPVIISESNLKH